MRCTTELTARFELTSYAMMDQEAFYDWDDEGNLVTLDVLDCDTVPFESVEEELSVELFEQDAAEDRAHDSGVCECKKCGLADEWDDGLLTYIAGEFRCAKCMPTGHGEITMMKELHERRRAREHKIRAARATKFREALETARQLRPDLNWARYEYDPRRYA